VFPGDVYDLGLSLRDRLPGCRRWTTADGEEDVVLQIAVGKHW
jgi:hypothetical protein